MIKTVLIDVDDTLLDFKECSITAIKQSMLDFNFLYKDEYYDVFQKENNRLWQMIENKTLTIEELHQIRWKNIFNHINLDGDYIAFEEHFVNYLKESSIPVSGANSLLEYLHKRYQIYIVSNATNRQQYRRLEKANMTPFIDKIFTSIDLGYSKPSCEFFQLCLEGLNKDEVIIIGDSLTADIKGGINAGIKTIWFNKYQEKIPNIQIDYIVDSLEEIKNIL